MSRFFFIVHVFYTTWRGFALLVVFLFHSNVTWGHFPSTSRFFFIVDVFYATWRGFALLVAFLLHSNVTWAFPLHVTLE